MVSEKNALWFAKVPHLFISDKSRELIGILKLKLTGHIIDILFLTHLFLIKITVYHEELSFFIERINFCIFDPVVEVRILLNCHGFHAPVISAV